MSNSFIIATMYSNTYKYYYNFLKKDCEYFNYEISPFIIDKTLTYNLDKNYRLLLYKIRVEHMLKLLDNYDTVIWLDSECRIIRPFPDHWLSNNYYAIVSKTNRGYNTLPINDHGFQIVTKKYKNTLNKMLVFIDYCLELIKKEDTLYEGLHAEYNYGVLFDIFTYSDNTLKNNVYQELSNYFRLHNNNSLISRGYYIEKNTIILHPFNHFPIAKDNEDVNFSANRFAFIQHFLLDKKEEYNKKVIKLLLELYKNSDSFLNEKIWDKLDSISPVKKYDMLYDTVYEFNDWYFSKNNIIPNTSFKKEETNLKNQNFKIIQFEVPKNFDMYKELCLSDEH